MKLNFEVLYWEPSTLEGREIEIMKNFKGEYEECLKFIENNNYIIFDGPYIVDNDHYS